MLTDAQRQAVRTAVIADSTANAFRLAGDAYSLKDWLNTVPGAGATSVWRTDTPVSDISNAINWSLYTPSGAMDDTTLADTLTTGRRSAQLLAIQTKQINLQMLIQGKDRLNCSPANVRAGLRDAVIAVPAGAAGASVSPGGASGATVLAACIRSAKRVEAILVSGTSTTGSTTASLLTFEGSADDSDVNWLVNN